MKLTMRLLALSILLVLGNTYVRESKSVHQPVAAHEADGQKADLIIFSFDRPLQLYALLESLEEYVTGIGSIQVIYRASSQDFQDEYKQLYKDFQKVCFTRQGTNPRADFKPLTLNAIIQSSNAHVLFAVDDIIVTDFFDCSRCIAALEKYNAYGFYLRMGRNLNSCYPMNSAPQKIPNYSEPEPGVMQWCFAQGEYDWKYPNTVDMTIYRKTDVLMQFGHMQFWAPNPLEATWAGRAQGLMHRTGLCFDHSKIVNVPLNVVQLDFTNRNMEFMTCAQLLDIFKQGKKIDLAPLHTIQNTAAHMAYIPTFIERTNA
jgi:hypothetical protein